MIMAKDAKAKAEKNKIQLVDRQIKAELESVIRSIENAILVGRFQTSEQIFGSDVRAAVIKELENHGYIVTLSNTSTLFSISW